jgi:HD-GYP domain-containing protein (c-di-GMP phosphodiesterase class II)
MGTGRSLDEGLVLSGGFGTSVTSSRAGFLPVCLDHIPPAMLAELDIYLRNGGPAHPELFTLFCSQSSSFTEERRRRLLDGGVRFIFIPMQQGEKFREQTESKLLDIVHDPEVAASVKAELVYETSVALVDEVLREPDLAAKGSRLEKVSRAVAMLVLSDPTAFSHLLTAAHHDFYTATHMVNVATCMVPLAYAMGVQDVGDLSHICEAGLLHDIGKNFVPAETLNKRGSLTAAEWAQIRRHPELGCEHLGKFEGIHPFVSIVTLQHHERLDGSGYPHGLRDESIHPVSRICAVVDSFDAMTAFRPFKKQTLSVDQAMQVLRGESQRRYDAVVVKAWSDLLEASTAGGSGGQSNFTGLRNRRGCERFKIDCKAQLHVLYEGPTGWTERSGHEVVAHSISQSGLCLLSQMAVVVGQSVRVHLLGKGTLDQVQDGVVMRCRQYQDGWFEIGLKYGTIGAIPEDLRTPDRRVA